MKKKIKEYEGERKKKTERARDNRRGREIDNERRRKKVEAIEGKEGFSMEKEKKIGFHHQEKFGLFYKILRHKLCMTLRRLILGLLLEMNSKL